MIEEVILVDELDNEMGVMEKIEAHKRGLLHRAFSIFIFNNKNELLLQKRAIDKYHSGGLWTNSCCSHPKPGENLSIATQRRLTEEMGLTKVETVEIRQGVIGRIFGFGDVIITGTGISNVVFKYVSKPINVKKEIESQLDKIQ